MLQFFVATFLAILFLLSGNQEIDCAPQPATQASYKAFRNLTYVPKSKEKMHRLDLYLPNCKRPGSGYPVVLYIHGGGWSTGDKAEPTLLDALTKSGFAIASINYRYAKEARFPAQIHDAKASIRWLNANAKKYGINAKKIAAFGGSAGGHLAALLGVTNGKKEFEGSLGNQHESSAVIAVCEMAAPSNMFSLDLPAKFLPKKGILMKPSMHLYPTTGLAFALLRERPNECPERARLASPVAWASKSSPPFLIFHGLKDSVVPASQSLELSEVLHANSVPCILKLFPDRNHADLGAAHLDDQILSFFRQYLR